ncbi:thermonuclease family protein [Methylomagnum ishizawai]|uniref:thermonuclease family protein n=1 Tax=Methylomagnum ishizawai TaxID=1760988 RepID=UPI001C340871|nr:thermonuclease family protein [Methylomagnum ishizawai]BBL75990.1 hypothetical protein MishRS11D_30880 [Methylomagnum ishizawai]
MAVTLHLAGLCKDNYGRTLGRVSCDGMDANLEQVKRGLAWFYVQGTAKMKRGMGGGRRSDDRRPGAVVEEGCHSALGIPAR